MSNTGLMTDVERQLYARWVAWQNNETASPQEMALISEFTNIVGCVASQSSLSPDLDPIVTFLASCSPRFHKTLQQRGRCSNGHVDLFRGIKDEEAQDALVDILQGRHAIVMTTWPRSFSYDVGVARGHARMSYWGGISLRTTVPLSSVVFVRESFANWPEAHLDNESEVLVVMNSPFSGGSLHLDSVFTGTRKPKNNTEKQALVEKKESLNNRWEALLASRGIAKATLRQALPLLVPPWV